MKRAAIVTRQLTKTTGAARNTIEQVDYLVGKGYQVDVIAEFINKPLVAAHGARPLRYSGWLLKGYWRRKLFAWRAQRQIRQAGYDLVFGHGDINHQDVLFLHNCVHLAHELIHDKPIPTNHIMGRIHGELLEKQDFRLLVANSGLMARDVVKRFSVPADKTVVVHPGYDPQQFNLLQHDVLRMQARKQLGIAEHTVLLGLITSGNFKKRNVELLISAMGELPPKVKQQCHLLVVGKEKQAQRFIDLAREQGLVDNFSLLQPMAHIQNYYHALDVQVLPARWEEFGRVVLESMACGLPVVVSDKVGAMEILSDANLPFVFPAGDKQALTEKLRTLIEDADLRRRLGSMNAQHATRFSASQQAAKLHDVLLKHGIV